MGSGFWKRSNIKDNKDYMSNETMGWHIYSPYSMKEHIEKNIKTPKKQFHKRYNWIHYVFKYKLFVPALMFFNKVYGKYLCKSVPDIWYNKNMKAFDIAFEKSIYDWHKRHLTNLCEATKVGERIKQIKKTPLWKKYKYHTGSKMLRSMKEMVLTMCLNDTVYREFMNILLFKITQEMQVAYPKNKADHLFYNSANVMDVGYYFLGNNMQKNGVELKRTK